MMKTREKIADKGLRKGATIDPTLADKYADKELFKEKFERQNAILRKGGLPKF